MLAQLKGTIEVHDLEDRAGNVTPLGSYAVSFPGGDGEPVGQIRDLGGPLSLQGTLRLPRQGGYELQGTVATRPEASPELINNLRFLGSPDAAGRRQFSLTGTFWLELAERLQQREVQRRAHRLGPERARQLDVGVQLCAVALDLLVEERLAPRRPRGGWS